MNKFFTVMAVGAAFIVGGLSVTPAEAHGYGYGWAHGAGWHPHKISCRKGRRIVRWRGFHRVRPVKCYGRFYVYRANKRGHLYRVRVHSHHGFIVSARPL